MHESYVTLKLPTARLSQTTLKIRPFGLLLKPIFSSLSAAQYLSGIFYYFSNLLQDHKFVTADFFSLFFDLVFEVCCVTVSFHFEPLRFGHENKNCNHIQDTD